MEERGHGVLLGDELEKEEGRRMIAQTGAIYRQRRNELHLASGGWIRGSDCWCHHTLDFSGFDCGTWLSGDTPLGVQRRIGLRKLL